MSTGQETTESLRKQVAAQMRVVASLAQSISEVHEQLAPVYECGGCTDSLLQMAGRRTAHLMETLGDILNEMDSASEDDGWMKPVFEEAQRLWPQEY